jgi:uncharacterized protein (TIGR03437 family)
MGTMSSGRIAAGSLFWIVLERPMLLPDGPLESDSASLATSLAGYSFSVDGAAIRLRSYARGRFVAQLPSGLSAGLHMIDAFDDGGNRVGISRVDVVAVSPLFVDSQETGARALRGDGSVIHAGNPAQPGDAILVRLTGQGPVKPANSDGQAASADSPSAPAGLITATVGGKRAKVISASMSTAEAGVLEVWLEVPNLYDGDHSGRIAVGPFASNVLPIMVKRQAPRAGEDPKVYQGPER